VALERLSLSISRIHDDAAAFAWAVAQKSSFFIKAASSDDNVVVLVEPKNMFSRFLEIFSLKKRALLPLLKKHFSPLPTDVRIEGCTNKERKGDSRRKWPLWRQNEAGFSESIDFRGPLGMQYGVGEVK